MNEEEKIMTEDTSADTVSASDEVIGEKATAEESANAGEISTGTEERTEAVEGAPAEAIEGTSAADSDATEGAAEFKMRGDIEEEKPVNPAAKKAKTLYIIIIAALVIAIGVLIVIFVNKSKGKESDVEPTKAPEASTEIKDSQGHTVVIGGDVEDTDPEEKEEELLWDEDRDYSVTVELGEYKGLKGTLTVEEPTAEEIDANVENFLYSLSTEEDVTYRDDVQNGDILIIDFAGTIDGVAFDGGTASDSELTVGEGRMIPGFEDALIGHKLGENFDINVTFPENYGKEDLNGKDAVFNITIKAIKEEVVPELTDELIVENTEFSTVAEYRDSVAADLLADAQADAETAMKNDVITKIIDSCTFGGGIDQEIADYTAYMIAYYDNLYQMYYGMTGAQMFAQSYGFSEEQYQDYMRNNSEYNIKFQHVLNAICDKENLTVSDEEYEKCFNEVYIDYYGYTDKEEVLQDYTQEEIDKYVNKLVRQEMANNLIVDSIIVDGE